MCKCSDYETIRSMITLIHKHFLCTGNLARDVQYIGIKINLDDRGYLVEYIT